MISTMMANEMEGGGRRLGYLQWEFGYNLHSCHAVVRFLNSQTSPTSLDSLYLRIERSVAPRLSNGLRAFSVIWFKEVIPRRTLHFRFVEFRADAWYCLI